MSKQYFDHIHTKHVLCSCRKPWKSFLILLTTFSVSFSLGLQGVFFLTTSYGFYPNVLSYLYGHIISSTSFSSSFSPLHFYCEEKKKQLPFTSFIFHHLLFHLGIKCHRFYIMDAYKCTSPILCLGILSVKSDQWSEDGSVMQR